MITSVGLVFGDAPPPVSKKRSTIHVEDFGRIKSATMELAPLTVLLGKNNSGKSYLASLIWAARGVLWWPGGLSGELIHAPKRFREFVNDETSGPHLVEARDSMRVINNWLDRIKDNLTKRVFNSDQISIGKLKFDIDGHLFLRRQAKPPRWMTGSNDFFQRTSVWSMSYDSKVVTSDVDSVVIGVQGSLQDNLFQFTAERLFRDNSVGGFFDPIYVPAARTGLMLALRDLIKGALSTYGRSPDTDRSTLTLTMPVVQFLRALVDSDRHPDKKIAEIADFLAHGILGGDIHVDNSDVPKFEYQPEKTDFRLPMHMVSSMVTELTPIIDIMRKRDLRAGFVIEEPEAHLHLSAQRCMARGIARLVNAGIPVVVTTHSDTFVQQLNILIQLQDKTRQFSSELGYSEEDLIKRDSVCAYELVQTPEGSHARECEIAEHGIVAPSLNETIIQLADELVRASAE